MLRCSSCVRVMVLGILAIALAMNGCSVIGYNLGKKLDERSSRKTVKEGDQVRVILNNGSQVAENTRPPRGFLGSNTSRGMRLTVSRVSQSFSCRRLATWLPSR